MHVPVLVDEVIKFLDPKPGNTFVDATFGDAGHSKVIAERVAPNGKILGIDWDPAQAAKHLGSVSETLIVVEDNYANIENIVRQHDLCPVDGVLFDLGFSVFHIENSGKGFSFRKDEPLIMRYGAIDGGITAEHIVNTWSATELERIIREYGEERFAARIAAAIVGVRRKKPIRTTLALADVVSRAMPPAARHGRIHPATRTFQALRIAVNDEFGNIKKGIVGAFNITKPGGSIVVISFHSLEDRIVKDLFREYEQKGVIKIITKKVVLPARQEIVKNPRARSAKLRVAKRI